MKLKLKQYSNFTVWSQTLTPDELTKLLGVEPDETRVRGSRWPEASGRKPVPRSHMWTVACRDGKLNVTDQIESVVRRLAPAREAIRALVEQEDATAMLTVARFFGDDEGEEQVTYWSDDPRVDVLPFGWYLDSSVIDFLSYVRAALNVGEYDMLDDSAEPEERET
jgi:hypothetical protein